MQLLNVALGGNLVQHLPDVPGARDPRAGTGAVPAPGGPHAPGTRLHGCWARRRPVTATTTRRWTGSPPELTPSAWAEDGVVEAVEATGRRFCLGVQWHPEESADRRLFAALVAAAGNGRENGRRTPLWIVSRRPRVLVADHRHQRAT